LNAKSTSLAFPLTNAGLRKNPFLITDKLGKEYQNDMFVGDTNNGRIYHFKLNQNRTKLLFQDALHDKVADADKELGNVVFVYGFGKITDLDIGPDGYLYFVDTEEKYTE
jgi:aldose sugar dehydrogenase